MEPFSKVSPIPGYDIREIQKTDSLALKKFEDTCSVLDGSTSLNSIQFWEDLVNSPDIGPSSVIAINKEGGVGYCGWYEVDHRVEENLVFLEGRVHPDFRGQGYGTALLDWLESNAIDHLRTTGIDNPCTFRIMYYDRAPDAPTLFKKRGYELMYIEQEMVRDLDGSIAGTDHDDLKYKNWTMENQADFYAVYRAAFQTRTENIMSSDSWQGHFANPNDEDFQPYYSFLAYKSGTPAAYTVVHTESDPDHPGRIIPWISQIGVHLDFRRSGVGTTLLGRTMGELKKAEFQIVKLSVNVDNSEAINLYSNIGFQIDKSLTMYCKPAALH